MFITIIPNLVLYMCHINNTLNFTLQYSTSWENVNDIFLSEELPRNKLHSACALIINQCCINKLVKNVFYFLLKAKCFLMT